MGKFKRKRRIRKLFPKKYGAGFVAVPSGVSQDHFNNPWTFRNRHVAARSLDPTPHTVKPQLSLVRYNENKSETTIEVLHSLYQDVRHQKPHPWHRGPLLLSSKREKITLWFSGDHYMFVREKLIGRKKASRSIIYRGRERANTVFRRDQITWSEHIYFDTPPPQADDDESPG